MRPCRDGWSSLAPLLLLLPLLRAAEANRIPKWGLHAQQVEKLLVDIEKSVRKVSEDSEGVFRTLGTYDQQLEGSLRREIGMLHTTSTRLRGMETKYHSEISASQAQLNRLKAAAHGSEEKAGWAGEQATKTGQTLDDLLSSVKTLVALLEGAAITPDGTLATPETPDARGEPSKVYGAIRRLLTENHAMQPRFPQVFAAFLSLPVAQQQQEAMPPRVSMTPALLTQTITAMSDIQAAVRKDQEKVLLQLEQQQRQFRGKAAAAKASADTQQGTEAEKEEKLEELSFSIAFTEAVLKTDASFHKQLLTSMEAKTKLKEIITNSEQNQLRTLKDLIGILDGKQAGTQKREPAALSFLEVASESDGSSRKSSSSLMLRVENALHNKADTHAILMEIKGIVDKVAPIDASSVQTVVAQMSAVLRQVQGEQSQARDAKRRCEAQKFQTHQAEVGQRATLALMSSARNHTQSAINAAKHNLKGISSKTTALERSSSDFSRIVARTEKTLEDHSHDRETILTAVRKAGEVSRHALPATAAPAVVSLLEELAKQLEQQEAAELSYRSEQDSLQGVFKQYVHNYVQLLTERRNHYDGTLSELELYSSELTGDEAAQSDSLIESKELKMESEDLCASIMKFYQKHGERRARLTTVLKKVLPRVPEILGVGGGSPE